MTIEDLVRLRRARDLIDREYAQPLDVHENFNMFIRNFLPKYPPPAADAIENLNMAVIVDQKRLGGGSHSTVGTVTDIYTVLRLLFSRAGKPHAGYTNVFSFNDPQGMCPECNGVASSRSTRLASSTCRSLSPTGPCRSPSSRSGRTRSTPRAASSIRRRSCPSSPRTRWTCSSTARSASSRRPTTVSRSTRATKASSRSSSAPSSSATSRPAPSGCSASSSST